jgi:hypothetical protein
MADKLGETINLQKKKLNFINECFVQTHKVAYQYRDYNVRLKNEFLQFAERNSGTLGFFRDELEFIDRKKEKERQRFVNILKRVEIIDKNISSVDYEEYLRAPNDQKSENEKSKTSTDDLQRGQPQGPTRDEKKNKMRGFYDPRQQTYEVNKSKLDWLNDYLYDKRNVKALNLKSRNYAPNLYEKPQDLQKIFNPQTPNNNYITKEQYVCLQSDSHFISNVKSDYKKQLAQKYYQNPEKKNSKRSISTRSITRGDSKARPERLNQSQDDSGAGQEPSRAIKNNFLANQGLNLVNSSKDTINFLSHQKTPVLQKKIGQRLAQKSSKLERGSTMDSKTDRDYILPYNPFQGGPEQNQLQVGYEAHVHGVNSISSR